MQNVNTDGLYMKIYIYFYGLYFFLSNRGQGKPIIKKYIDYQYSSMSTHGV